MRIGNINAEAKAAMEKLGLQKCDGPRQKIQRMLLSMQSELTEDDVDDRWTHRGS